ncbi:hypothetical protein L1987_32208 [Smallanthus sonchifolius]|uniref:Uncharacterized protein n=1 Tax=Smallanthus sonchifolius TaxID=185202 RepID=A0ACB9I957_9ASTR|nr:hypothetical protein L1987_32208 [Smallanthus sonchifolius]
MGVTQTGQFGLEIEIWQSSDVGCLRGTRRWGGVFSRHAGDLPADRLNAGLLGMRRMMGGSSRYTKNPPCGQCKPGSLMVRGRDSLGLRGAKGATMS